MPFGETAVRAKHPLDVGDTRRSSVADQAQFHGCDKGTGNMRRLLADYQSAVRPITLLADKRTGFPK
jgi:hypothetical protein